MRKRVPLLLVIFLCPIFILSSLLFLGGCKKKETKVETKLANVQTQSAEKRALKPYVEAIGTLNANEEVTVSAEIDGIVRDVRVDEGSVVTKGMVLAALDDTDYDLEVKRAQAAVRQAEATLSNTQLEYKRKEALVKEELVTKQQFEDVATRLALADADLERAKASVSLAKTKLAKTKIYSPLACAVKEKKVSTGDYVKNGTQLFVIIQSNPIKVNFFVAEKDVGKLRKNQEAILRVNAFPGREFKGKVNIIYPSLDEKTRTLKVEALVPNPDGLLKPGLFAKVILYTDEAQSTVVVPITALLYEEERIRVFVVEGDTAHERPIKVGAKYGEVIEVTEGLKEGETVVVAGQAGLSEGAKVRVQPAAAPRRTNVSG
jgi:membrane fusion protein, multidrug efflux system